MLSNPTFHRITNANKCSSILHSPAFSRIYFWPFFLSFLQIKSFTWFYFSWYPVLFTFNISVILYLAIFCCCSPLSFLYALVILVCLCINLHWTGKENVTLPIHFLPLVWLKKTENIVLSAFFHWTGFKNIFTRHHSCTRWSFSASQSVPTYFWFPSLWSHSIWDRKQME